MKRLVRSQLLYKYVLLIAGLVSTALLISGALGLYASYQENLSASVRIQHEKAVNAALRIEQFVDSIVRELAAANESRRSGGIVTPAERRLDYLRLLRHDPAITELSRLRADGREEVHVSRLELDELAAYRDRSQEPVFLKAKAQGRYFSPVYFRKNSEPYMSVALAMDDRGGGVSIAEVNLKFVWDVVSTIRVGETGLAYVVDSQGILIAHPDLSLVLRKLDLAAGDALRIPAAGTRTEALGSSRQTTSIDGRPVLTSRVVIASLGWQVFVEQPMAEVLVPVYAAAWRAAALLAVGLLIAVLASVLLARAMVKPIHAMDAAVRRLGAGDLDSRIDLQSGDELQRLGESFNRMAGQLDELYKTLETRIAERTRELSLANQAKTRFLAAASHDLRQPAHALGLFAGQLRYEAHTPRLKELAEQIEASIAALEELLDSLLDISRLDAGAVATQVRAVSMQDMMARLAVQFEGAAADKGLALRLIPTRLSVRSDAQLLERILTNLLSNAIRYSAHGKVLVGCRRRGAFVAVMVLDNGIGIAEDMIPKIFQEFYQLDTGEAGRSHGLGLGLAIVDRLVRLLGHEIQVRSIPGKGSSFSIVVPVADTEDENCPAWAPAEMLHLSGVRVLIIDDEPLTREATAGILLRWGCEAVTAGGADEAIARIGSTRVEPDLLICDLHLAGDGDGIAAIARIQSFCGARVPALIVTGDTAPEQLALVKASGHALLQKPVKPAMLRALIEHFLGAHERKDLATASSTAS